MASPRIETPRIAGEYTPIYQPAGDVYEGIPTPDLSPGTWYPEWVPNDHGFVKGHDGCWHLFGITHPLTRLDRVHDGEVQSFHARAPAGDLVDVLRPGAWQDLPKVLTPRERPGEIPEQHAPAIVRHQGLYHMVYGPNPIRLATSPDLLRWTPAGALFAEEPTTRDPCLLRHEGLYLLVFCVRHEVRLRTSPDLRRWSASRTLLRVAPDTTAPESPCLVSRNGLFYLFVCGWDGVWDQRDLLGAYQHRTYVYAAESLDGFAARPQVAVLDAHAPEVVQGEDGQWCLSSAEWPRRGVSLARLVWE